MDYVELKKLILVNGHKGKDSCDPKDIFCWIIVCQTHGGRNDCSMIDA